MSQRQDDTSIVSAVSVHRTQHTGRVWSVAAATFFVVCADVQVNATDEPVWRQVLQWVVKFCDPAVAQQVATALAE
jgi:hypothetical protein